MVMMIASIGDDHGSIVVDGPDSFAAAADLRTLRYR